MKTKTPWIIFIACCLTLSAFLFPQVIVQDNQLDINNADFGETPYIQAFEDHSAIYITGDDNLTDWGFPGIGSEINPFRIDGYNFTVNGTAIYVADISLHLLINGCVIQNIESGVGDAIYFENVTAGSIENCRIIGKSNGIEIVQSDSCSVYNVEITGTTSYALNLSSSTDCTISESYIHHVSSDGIYDTSTRTIISDTVIHNVGSHGIFAEGANITVSECDISYTGSTGIRNEAWNSVYSDNKIYHCSDDGILDYTARYSTFSNNRVFGNLGHGVRMATCRYEVLTGNAIFNNQDIGLYQSGMFSGNSKFYSNSIGWHSQNAVHDGDNTNTYDDSMSVGNAWSDYSGTGIYSIYGAWGGTDNYPSILSDSTAPSILLGPSDVLMSPLESKTITWSVESEDYPDSYTVIINGTEITEKWDGEDIDFTLEGLSQGSYLCELLVEDCAGNSDTDSLLIEVYGFAINSPDDIIMEAGSLDCFIEWTATAADRNYYEIYVNGLMVKLADWDMFNITFDFEYGYGLYEVEIRVYNSTNHYLSDFVQVQVTDSFDPIISDDLGLYYLEKDSILTLAWSVSDVNPGELILWKNGSIYLQSSWDFPVFSIEIVGDEVGTWNYTLEIIDLAGRTATDTAIIIVRDTSPTSSEPITTTTTENTTQLNQLQDQIFTQSIIIGSIGVLVGISLLLNVLIFRKFNRKGK